MARRATVIKAIRNRSENPVLVLDAGNTLLGQELASRSEGRVIVDAMNAMEYDAMTVGFLDLSKGVDILLQRAQEARFAILSCNIVNIGDEKPILPPYVIIERDSLRFGVLGVSEPDVARFAPEDMSRIKVLDPVATVQKYLPEVQSRSDVVLLLSHLGFDEDKALAEAVPGIDVIVGGRSRKLMRAPERAGETVVVQMGYDGEWLGKSDVAFDAQGQICESSIQMMTLGPDVFDDRELSLLVDSYKKRFPSPTPGTQ